MYDNHVPTHTTFLNSFHKCIGGPLHAYVESNPNSEVLNAIRSESCQTRITDLYVEDVNIGSSTEHILSATLSFPRLLHCELVSASNAVPLRTASLFTSANRLRVLRLNRFPFVPSDPLPSLTHLQIDTIPSQGSPLATVNDLLTVLSLAPNLRVLELIHVAHGLSKHGYIEWNDGSESLHLPHLERFSSFEPATEGWQAAARDTTKTRDTLFPRISIPAACNVHLGWVRADQLAQLTKYFNLDARRATHLRISSPRTHSANSHAGAGSRLQFELSNPATKQTWSLHVETDYPEKQRISYANAIRAHVARQLSEAFATLSMFTSVKRLWLDLDEPDWLLSPVVGSLPALEEVAISEGAAHIPIGDLHLNPGCLRIKFAHN